jgi:hypothetical protein
MTLFVVTVLLLTSSVEATHEVDHRYVVLGNVRDRTGQPVARSQVRVVRVKTGFPYQAETDGDGFYLLVVHLHNEDLLDPLQVAAGPTAIRIQARFNPLDMQSHRGTRVDFAEGQPQERQEMFTGTLAEYLGH